jgi:tetratricopeptide (TPR) repeat protein
VRCDSRSWRNGQLQGTAITFIHQPSQPDAPEIVAHLRDLCASEAFARSPQAKKLLRYLVNAALRDAGPGVFKGAVIGVEVFGLPPAHDPNRHSIVRVAVRTLRDTLANYYETEGRHDAIRIRLPERSYLPQFQYDAEAAALKLDSTSAMHVANAKTLMNKRTLGAFQEALRYLESALERHPEHPRLLSLIAMVNAASAMYGRHPRKAFEVARTLLDRARQSGREPWELLIVEAWITMHMQFDWSRADQLFERAMQLNPIEVRQHTWYTAFLASQLRWNEFLSLVEGAASGSEYDSAYSRGRLAIAQIVAGRLDDAAETLRLAFEIFPHNHHTTYLHLAVLREALGDFSGASQVFEQMGARGRETTLGLGLEVLVRGLAGERETAQRLQNDLLAARKSEEHFIPALQVGLGCVGTGDLQGAVRWIEQACLEECDPLSSWIGILPTVRHLRGEDGFNSLVRDHLKLKFRDDHGTPAA